MSKLDAVRNQLNRIARQNDTRFSIGVLCSARADVPTFEFVCRDPDEVDFVSGFGTTPDEAAAEAQREIADACNSWGYTYVD